MRVAGVKRGTVQCGGNRRGVDRRGWSAAVLMGPGGWSPEQGRWTGLPATESNPQVKAAGAGEGP